MDGLGDSCPVEAEFVLYQIITELPSLGWLISAIKELLVFSDL